MTARFLLQLFLIVAAASIMATAPACAVPPVERLVLSNKLKVIVAQEHSLPFATLQLLVDSGSRKDPPGKEGLARLTARGMLLGTEKRTAEIINRELDFSRSFSRRRGGARLCGPEPPCA
jgi:zinc protease